VATVPWLTEGVQLLRGDVVLTRSDSWLARAIRAVAGQAYSHTAIVSKGGFVDIARIVESDKRIRQGGLLEHHARDFVNVWRPLNVDDDTVDAIVSLCEARIGEPYGVGEFFTQLPDAILRKLIGRNIVAARRLNRMIPGTQCSGLIAGAFSQLSLNFGVEPYAATPQDIDRYCASNPSKYQKVFGERPDLYVREVLRQQWTNS
jgi:hypothetical protein